MPHKPQFKGVLKAVRAFVMPDLLSAEDKAFIQSDQPWNAADRQRVQSVLDALINSTVDNAGIQRVNFPVEFVAAAIAEFVNPVNWPQACEFALNRSTMEQQLGAGEGSGPLTTAQVFAMICEIEAGNADLDSVASKAEKQAKVKGAPVEDNA